MECIVGTGPSRSDRAAPVGWTWLSMSPGTHFWRRRSTIFKCWTLEPEHLSVGADGQESISSNGDRLSSRFRCRNGEDVRVVIDRVRGLCQGRKAARESKKRRRIAAASVSPAPL